MPPAASKPGRPPERVVLRFYFKMALSTPPEIKDITLPKNWPVPQPGDQVSTDGFVGIVTNLHFKFDENILIVNLR